MRKNNITEEKKLDVAKHLLSICLMEDSNRIIRRYYISDIKGVYSLIHEEELMNLPYQTIFEKYYPDKKSLLTFALRKDKNGEAELLPELYMIVNNELTPISSDMWSNEDFITELATCMPNPIKCIDFFDGKPEK